jgi:hypothetical protein
VFVHVPAVAVRTSPTPWSPVGVSAPAALFDGAEPPPTADFAVTMTPAHGSLDGLFVDAATLFVRPLSDCSNIHNATWPPPVAPLTPVLNVHPEPGVSFAVSSVAVCAFRLPTKPTPYAPLAAVPPVDPVFSFAALVPVVPAPVRSSGVVVSTPESSSAAITMFRVPLCVTVTFVSVSPDTRTRRYIVETTVSRVVQRSYLRERLPARSVPELHRAHRRIRRGVHHDTNVDHVPRRHRADQSPARSSRADTRVGSSGDRAVSYSDRHYRPWRK